MKLLFIKTHEKEESFLNNIYLIFFNENNEIFS